ncbi:pseudouridine synthase [Bacteroidia bacterium]|nr:pseudouridine synthase [Bacteroidia bacterium]
MADKPLRFSVKESQTLTAFFALHFKGKSRSDIKSLLAHKQLLVNDQPVSRLEHPLTEGDIVIIRKDKPEFTLEHPKARIVFEDGHLVVIEKVEGLLSVATDGRKDETTAFSILSEYLRLKNQHPFIVHRIDRETSGLLMFAKNREMQLALQDNWHEIVSERTYIAVVEGVPEKEADTITSYLHENRALQIYSSQKARDGRQKAVTRYRVICKNERYAMLRVELETGKKNQIRVHLQEIGHPIVGDKKYGATSSPIGRMGLHAQVLEFVHPATKETLRFETPIPWKFRQMIERRNE